MWQEREQIATHLHNMGLDWPVAWEMADKQLENRSGVNVAQRVQQEAYPVTAEESEMFYYVRVVNGDDTAPEGVTDPRRVKGAARVALLSRQLRNAVPGASVNIQLPGVGNTLMGWLEKHLTEELEIITEFGDREGETFTPVDLVGNRQRTLIADHPVPFLSAESEANEDDGNDEADR